MGGKMRRIFLVRWNNLLGCCAYGSVKLIFDRAVAAGSSGGIQVCNGKLVLT
jgi:hypothetical protein